MYIVVEGVNKKETTKRSHVIASRLNIDPILLSFPSDHSSSARALRHTLEFSTVLSDEQREALILKEFKLLNDYALSLIAKGHSVIINGGPCSYLYCQDAEPQFTTIKKIMNMLPKDTLVEKVTTPPIKIIGKSRMSQWLDKDENIQTWINRIEEFSKTY